MAAAPPAPAAAVPAAASVTVDVDLIDDVLSTLPTTKVYKLTKDLASRNIKCQKAVDVLYPEFFHTLNLENFDGETLRAMFYDLQAGDVFFHFLQGARFSFRVTRGPQDAPPSNWGAILGRIRLATVLGRVGITLLPNENLTTDNCDWEYEDMPLSLPAAKAMADQIKDDYTAMFTKEGATPALNLLSDAVLEFSTKRPIGIWIKAVRPTAASVVPPVPAAAAAAPPAPTAMAVDAVLYPSLKGTKRPRKDTAEVVAAATIMVQNLAGAKKRPQPSTQAVTQV